MLAGIHMQAGHWHWAARGIVGVLGARLVESAGKKRHGWEWLRLCAGIGQVSARGDACCSRAMALGHLRHTVCSWVCMVPAPHCTCTALCMGLGGSCFVHGCTLYPPAVCHTAHAACFPKCPSPLCMRHRAASAAHGISSLGGHLCRCIAMRMRGACGEAWAVAWAVTAGRAAQMWLHVMCSLAAVTAAMRPAGAGNER